MVVSNRKSLSDKKLAIFWPAVSFLPNEFVFPGREDQSENAVTIKMPPAGQLIILGSLLAARGACADVTVQEQMSLEASILKAIPPKPATFPGKRSVTSTSTVNGQTLQTFAEMTVETVSIDASPVAPARFEVPAGYKKLTPAAAKTDESVSCPSS
jgi:hypothetical protein